MHRPHLVESEFMTLRLPDAWVWDSWYVQDDAGVYHCFFLKASRSLVDPERRHMNACIGHATSTDLRVWEPAADALMPAESPGFDDTAVWTGCVVRSPEGWWLMFYTGVGNAPRGVVQRIGVARSIDLFTWERVGSGALVEPDPKWYESSHDSDGAGEAWRDPWVFPDPDGDGWHMLITAHAVHGPVDGRGVIGHARSTDLLRWEVGPPLTSPAGFGHLEVPQVAVVDGQPLLVFCSNLGPRAAAHRIWCIPGDSLTGPWDMTAARPVSLPASHIYAPRLIRDRAGEWQLMGFVDEVAGRFVGELSNPIPVAYTTRGLMQMSGEV